jgi:hypothetical protein
VSARRPSLTRRKLLRGAGVCITLPAFYSLLPRGSRAEGESTLQKLIVIGHPNGTTQREGEANVPEGLRSRLAPVEGLYSVIKNINNDPLKKDQYQTGTGTAHSSCFTPFMAGQAHDGPGNERKTFDQYLAEDPLHQGVRIPSISINLGKKNGADDGIPQSWFNTWSWKGPDAPIPMYHQPRKLFEDLFADFEPVEDPALRARLERKQLMLDAVYAQIQDLKPRLNNTDRIRLDQYLTGVEELDRKTQGQLDGGTALQCNIEGPPAIDVPNEPATLAAGDYTEVMGLMQDLVVLAMQCDATRITTFLHGSCAGSNVLQVPYVQGMEGSVKGWHPLSHWNSPYGNLSNDPELNWRDLERLLQWHYDRVVEFVQKLAAVPGAGGQTLLDDTLVSFGSWMGYGLHRATNLYQIVFGSGGGRFKQGVEIEANPGNEKGPRSIADLWLTVLRGFGQDVSSFGIGSDGIDELLV